MLAADIVLVVLFAGLSFYAILGGADFGAGFWDLTAGGPERGARIRGLIKRSISPVWEANHVWLIFVLVILWTGFPQAFAAIMETLYVPLFVALLGIVLRGAAFALRGQAATIAEARALGAVFAISSVVVPFFLGAAVGGVASGRVPADGAGELWSSWLNPTSIVIGILFVAVCAYVAAVFLAADADRIGDPDLVGAMRSRALGAAVGTGALALVGLLIVRDDAPALYDGLTSGAGLGCLVASLVLGAGTLALIWRADYRRARWASALTAGTVLAGWALAQSGEILPGELTIEEAAADEATLIALIVITLIAAVILIPSLAWLFRLTLADRLGGELSPITAGLERGGAAGSDREAGAR